MNDQLNTRLKSDSMGEIAVPADRDWGAQAQHSPPNLGIGGERMPVPLSRALALAWQGGGRDPHEAGLTIHR